MEILVSTLCMIIAFCFFYVFDLLYKKYNILKAKKYLLGALLAALIGIFFIYLMSIYNSEYDKKLFERWALILKN